MTVKTYRRVISLGSVYTLEGKRCQKKKTIKVFANSKREADIKLDLLAATEKANFAQSTSKTVTAVNTMNDLVEFYDKRILRKVTTRSADMHLWNPKTPALGLKSFWGTKKLSSITEEMFQKFIDECKECGWSHNKIHRIYQFFAKHFALAQRKKIITNNPFPSFVGEECAKVPEVRKIDGEAMKKNISKFFSKIFREKDVYSTVRFKSMLLLCADGALREAELFGLSPQSIELDKKILHITRNYFQVDKRSAESLSVQHCGFSTPKTKGSARRLPISAITARYVRLYLEMSRKYCVDNNLTNVDGFLYFAVRNLPDRASYNKYRVSTAPMVNVLPPTKRAFNSAIARWCKRYGIESFTSHKIRKWTNDIRRNDLSISKEERDYVLGHSEKYVDATYNLTDLYQRVTNSHEKWEVYLNNIIGTVENSCSTEIVGEIKKPI